MKKELQDVCDHLKEFIDDIEKYGYSGDSSLANIQQKAFALMQDIGIYMEKIERGQVYDKTMSA